VLVFSSIFLGFCFCLGYSLALLCVVRLGSGCDFVFFSASGLVVPLVFCLFGLMSLGLVFVRMFLCGACLCGGGCLYMGIVWLRWVFG